MQIIVDSDVELPQATVFAAFVVLTHTEYVRAAVDAGECKYTKEHGTMMSPPDKVEVIWAMPLVWPVSSVEPSASEASEDPEVGVRQLRKELA